MWRICGVSKAEPVLFARNPDDDYVSAALGSVSEIHASSNLTNDTFIISLDEHDKPCLHSAYV